MLVYKVTDLRNGRVYIGQTIKTLEQRRNNHYWTARHHRNIGRRQAAFANVLLSAPMECFHWEVIATASTQQELDELEAKYVKQHRSLIDERGYNCQEGGGGRGKASLVSRERMRLAQLGITASMDTRWKMSNTHRIRMGKEPLTLAAISDIRFNPSGLSEAALARKHDVARCKLDGIRERARGW